MRLWAAAIVLAGCDESSLSSPRGCSSRTDCPASEQCIAKKCLPVGCSSDPECGAGRYCDRASRACHAGGDLCSTNDACPSGQRCNLIAERCELGHRECSIEGDCTPIGLHCHQARGLCAECESDPHCGSESVCADGVCADPLLVECTTDSVCDPPATVCVDRACTAGCTASSCGVGERCDDASGRCVPNAGQCATDLDCAPPSTVCEGTACVPSCLEGGGLVCAIGTGCSPLTGRCVLLREDCGSDADCQPPASICAAGRCRPGCGEPNGEACAAFESCSAGTGRCEPTSCSLDADCGPPSSICDASTSRCAPGCGMTSCGGGEVCNGVTGRCEPDGAPLNASCASDADCASAVCFDFGAGAGQRCVSACGSSSDCPTGFACHSYEGAHLCISGALFQGSPAFAAPSGASCSSSPSCHSGLCTGAICNERCMENDDCAGFGDRCAWYEAATDRYEQACAGPAGTRLDGDTCSSDGQCASGVCFRGPGTSTSRCAVHCGSTADCGAGQICGVLDYSLCLAGGSSCSSWLLQSLTICVDEIGAGIGAVGSSCTQPEDCRSLLCSLGTCSDTCATDADCPLTYACKPTLLTQLSGGQPLRFNTCRPR